ncbi:hypothetical protein TcYC6_0175310, partial [Trypanosoma cruzi]
MDVDTAMKTALFHAPSDRRTEPPSLSPSPLPSLRDPVTSGRSLSGRTASRRHARGCRGLAVPSGGVRWTRSAACVCTGVGEQGRARVVAGALCACAPPRDYPVMHILCALSSIGALTSQHKNHALHILADAPSAKALFVVRSSLNQQTRCTKLESKRCPRPPPGCVCVYIYIYYIHAHAHGCSLGFLETDLDMMI